MGLIKFMKPGVWSLESASDPRWNDSGEDLVGMSSMPPAAQRSLDRTKALLGEDPPPDLEWSYHKY
jgi:hypothetical protein